jgi:hypothetical protein
MKSIIKGALGWGNWSNDDRRAFLRRFELTRYRVLYWFSFFVSILPIPLRLILSACLSDKHQAGEHQYGNTYGALFWRFKYRPITLLEIGIGGYEDRPGGQSLNAWQCFFPFAKLVACDIQDRAFLATPRTIIRRLDQSDAEQLGELRDSGQFDIIIDDGSHMNTHQILTFKVLWPSLRSGGVYIVEDVQTSFWSYDGWDGTAVNAPEFSETCVGYFAKLAPYVNISEFQAPGDKELMDVGRSVQQILFEHNLIVIIKH